MWADFLHAARRLRRTPGFTLAAVLVLALGIGVGTAMFSVINAVFLRPLPYAHPERLMRIEAGMRRGVALPLIRAWQQQTHSFSSIAFSESNLVALQQRGRTDMVEQMPVSTNLFATLGITAPPLHRNEVILSHALWRTVFDGKPGLSGRSIGLDGKSYTVVGVLPARASFPPDNTVLYTPFQPKPQDLTWMASSYLDVIARLRPGVTQAEAQAEMSAIEAQLSKAHTGMMGAPKQVTVTSYRSALEGHVGPTLAALSWATLVIWLIACLSVAGLLLTRHARRRRELAVCAALGARRWELVRPLLMEGTILGAIAGAIGWAMAVGGLALLDQYIVRKLPFGLAHVQVSGFALAGLLAITVISVLVIGVAPALVASSTPAQAGLRDAGNAAPGGRAQSRLRSGLVISEIALALLLLAGAALLLRTIYALRSVPLGFAIRNIITTPLVFPRHMFDHRDMVASFDQPLLDRARALPGVEMASLCTTIPLEQHFEATVYLGGMDSMNSPHAQRAALRIAGPEFPKVFGIPLLRGRWFDARLDTPKTAKVAVVNEAFARVFFSGQEALGRKELGHLIIGILANVHGRAVGLPPQPAIYYSMTQLAPGHPGIASISTDLAVRTSAPVAATIAGLRSVLNKLAPQVAPQGFSTMQELVNKSIGNQIFAVRLLTIFGLAALAIALTGIYGLLAYAVRERTREIGIRMALGAQQGPIERLVLTNAAWLIGIGVAIGLTLSYLLAHLLSSYLYGIRPHDAWSLAGAAVLLAACGLCAAWLPARRAARISPLEALRCD